jgi:hypothetical protein
MHKINKLNRTPIVILVIGCFGAILMLPIAMVVGSISWFKDINTGMIINSIFQYLVPISCGLILTGGLWLGTNNKVRESKPRN